MSIPYYVLAIVYLVVLVGYLFVLGFNLYHMVRWGLFNFTGQLNTALLFAAILIIMVVTAVLLSQVDWSSSFSPFDVSIDSLGFNDL